MLKEDKRAACLRTGSAVMPGFERGVGKGLNDDSRRIARPADGEWLAFAEIGRG